MIPIPPRVAVLMESWSILHERTIVRRTFMHAYVWVLLLASSSICHLGGTRSVDLTFCVRAPLSSQSLSTYFVSLKLCVTYNPQNLFLGLWHLKAKCKLPMNYGAPVKQSSDGDLPLIRRYTRLLVFIPFFWWMLDFLERPPAVDRLISSHQKGPHMNESVC